MKLRLVTRRAVGYILMALLFCCCQQRSLLGQNLDNASARAYNAAAALQNAGLYARAATKWSEFISQYPRDNRIGRASYFLGVCRLREKKYDESAELFRVVLSRWPDLQQADKAQYNLAMSRYAIASEAKEAAGFQEAAKNFERVVSQYPDSVLVDDSLYYRGDCLFNAGQFEGAIVVYQNLIAKHPTSTHAARAHYDMGVAQQELKRMAEAAKTFQAFVDKPECESHELASEVRLRWAICLHAIGDLDRAAEQFERVSRIPEYELASFAAFRLGQTKQQQQKYVEAAKLLNDFPKMFPKSDYQSDAMNTAGHCYYLADQPQDAVRVLAPVARSNDPAAAEAAYWLGRAQLKLSQADQALQTIDSAIHRFGSDPFGSYLQFARIDALYEIPNRRHETPKLYESFLREHPNHALASQAAYMAALACFGHQDFRKARELAEAHLAKPEQVEPAVMGDLKYIAAESYLLDSPGDNDARNKALTLYRELVTKFPTHSRAARSQLRIGWCLQAEQKPHEAIKHLRGVLSKLDRQQHVPEALLLVGRCHSELNANREAITAFNEAIAANGKWDRIDELLLALAESYRALGELDSAVDQLRRLADTQPQSELRPQACYWLGEIAQQREHYDQAGGWFKQVAEQYATSDFAAPAMHALAAVHLAKKEYPETRQWATRLIDGTAGDPLKQRGRYLRGLACHRENQCGEAIEDLKAYVQDPVEEDEARDAAYTLVLCQIAEKQFDAAGDVLDRLLKAAPDFPQADKAYYELGHGFRSENKSARAADAFQWIADNRPESELCPESWFRVAQSHADVAGKADDEQTNASYTAAETALANGLAKAKDSPIRESMQYLLGELQFQQHRFADAAQTLTTQIHEFPGGQYVGSATFLAAQSHEQLQQYDLALPLFAQITALPFPDTPDDRLRSYHAQALYYAGDCAAKLDRWQESQTHFQKLVDQYRTFPKLAEARYGVAFAVQQQGQLDSALEIYEQVTQQTETETAAKARFMIGEIEFGRKKFENAIEHFLLVTVGYPYESWQALARLETARCFVELGDEERAVRTLREMIEKHPQHTRAIDAKKMLEDLTK